MADQTIYFATNRRQAENDNRTVFTRDFVGDGRSVRFGKAEFVEAELTRSKIEAFRSNAEITIAPDQITDDSNTLPPAGGANVLGSMADEMTPGGNCELTIYLHGFDYTYRQSLIRTVELKVWLQERPSIFFMFAWPSLGRGVSTSNYRNDMKRARKSGVAIGRAILKTTQFILDMAETRNCSLRIHLLAHSMGSAALSGAVQYLNQRTEQYDQPLFDQVLLMAADEDRNALSQRGKLKPLLNDSRRITVYYSQTDLALIASDVVVGNSDRLGQKGPSRARDLSPKVQAIDVSDTLKQYEDIQLHQYYRVDEQVRADMLGVLGGESSSQLIDDKTRERRHGRLIVPDEEEFDEWGINISA